MDWLPTKCGTERLKIDADDDESTGLLVDVADQLKCCDDRELIALPLFVQNPDIEEP